MTKKIKKFFIYLFHSPEAIALHFWDSIAMIVPDKLFLSVKFRICMGYWMDFSFPKTFNEKLQWLKLYNKKPEYTMMVDKYAVKEYVSKIVGKKYIIPTIGAWEKPEDIEWERLPKQFVLKTTHGGGNNGVVICKDKSTFDKQQAINKLKNNLKQDLFLISREWPYKNVPRKIIAEQYINPCYGEGDLPDYKFFCFDGEVKALFIGTERSSGDVKFDFFDADFNHLNLIQVHPMSGKKFTKPKNFEEMKLIASKLSKGLPHVRVDLYNIDGRILFGEMTFFHHGGVVPFHPEKWDYEFGSWIELPKKN